MTDYPKHRKVVAVCVCAGSGEAVYCDDGAVFYYLLNGDAPRVPVEGTPVPGSEREAERGGASEASNAWQAVARNLAQVLLSVHQDDFTFKHQCDAHGITP